MHKENQNPTSEIVLASEKALAPSKLLTTMIWVGRRFIQIRFSKPHSASNRDGNFALCMFAGINSPETVKILLDKGANPNTKDKEEMTPLMFAVDSGCLDNVKLLLDRGANLNAKSIGFFGMTPLMFAVKGGHFDIAKLLLDRGADPNAKAPFSMTPLKWVVNRPDIEKLLIERGAIPESPAAAIDTSQTRFGRRPRHWRRKLRAQECCR